MDAEIKSQAIESRAGSIESAIEAGLARLELNRDEVDIEVLDEGSRGILGIGSRDAIVRLIPRTAVHPQSTPTSITPPVTTAPVTAAEVESKVPDIKYSERFDEEQEAAATDTMEEEEEESAAYLEQEREAAILILTELLDKMQVKATVTARVSEPDEVSGRRVNLLNVTGEDLGALIGPRGDTLDALQYVSRLMVADKLHRRANFTVDVEGYRERRQQALVRLAERMADKVRQRQEPISLEPMPPYERRIIHMTLRNAPGVYTESTGEGERRKVRIYPQ
jgi:spoIIIJ-associated protein